MQGPVKGPSGAPRLPPQNRPRSPTRPRSNHPATRLAVVPPYHLLPTKSFSSSYSNSSSIKTPRHTLAPPLPPIFLLLQQKGPASSFRLKASSNSAPCLSVPVCSTSFSPSGSGSDSSYFSPGFASRLRSSRFRKILTPPHPASQTVSAHTPSKKTPTLTSCEKYTLLRV